MRLFRITLANAVLFATLSAHSAPSARSAPPGSLPDGPPLDEPTDAASDPYAMLRFAPLWVPVPKFAPNPNAEPVPVPSAAYDMIWQAEWHQEIDLSAEQKKALLAINAKALADDNRHVEHFKSLPAEEREAQAKSGAGNPRHGGSNSTTRFANRSRPCYCPDSWKR
jgi:hypothetical protein